MAVSGADFTVLFQRLRRLARLDTSVFADIYADARATVPVVVFAAVALLLSGLGGMIYIATLSIGDQVPSFARELGVRQPSGFDLYKSATGHGAGEFFLLSVVLGTVFGLAMLAAWAGVSTLILKQVARVSVDWLGMARVLCVTTVPLVLALLLFAHDTLYGLGLIAFGGMATLALIGLLESVDVRPGHGWLATIAGFAVFIIVLVFLGYGSRDLAPGFFAIGR